MWFGDDGGGKADGMVCSVVEVESEVGAPALEDKHLKVWNLIRPNLRFENTDGQIDLKTRGIGGGG